MPTILLLHDKGSDRYAGLKCLSSLIALCAFSNPSIFYFGCNCGKQSVLELKNSKIFENVERKINVLGQGHLNTPDVPQNSSKAC